MRRRRRLVLWLALAGASACGGPFSADPVETSTGGVLGRDTFLYLLRN